MPSLPRGGVPLPRACLCFLPATKPPAEQSSAGQSSGGALLGARPHPRCWLSTLGGFGVRRSAREGGDGKRCRNTICANFFFLLKSNFFNLNTFKAKKKKIPSSGCQFQKVSRRSGVGAGRGIGGGVGGAGPLSSNQPAGAQTHPGRPAPSSARALTPRRSPTPPPPFPPPSGVSSGPGFPGRGSSAAGLPSLLMHGLPPRRFFLGLPPPPLCSRCH